MRLLGARDDEQAGGVAVEPVDDPGPVRRVAAGEAADQPVDERPRRVARRRVHDDPRRLVDHEQVLVLVGDTQRNVLADDLSARHLRELDLEPLPALQPAALGDALAVQRRRPAFDQALGRTAGADLRHSGEKPVEPLAGGPGGNDERLGRQKRGRREVSPSSSARNRIPTPITMKESARLKAGQ